MFRLPKLRAIWSYRDTLAHGEPTWEAKVAVKSVAVLDEERFGVVESLKH